MWTDEIAEQVINERMQSNPDTRRLYLHDATFHASLTPTRRTLAAVAQAMQRCGMEAEVVPLLRQAARILLDEHTLAAQQRAEEFAAKYADLSSTVTPLRLRPLA